MIISYLFDPKSILLIGASADTNSWGYWLAEQLINSCKNRTVHLISNKEQTILGHQCQTTVTTSADLAIIAVPKSNVESVVDQVLNVGVKGIIIITSGFGEIDLGGEIQEKRILKKIKDKNVFLLGPNCAGIWDSYSGFHCLPVGEFESGPVGFISQSGGIITDVFLRLKEVGLGFSKAVSIGNQVSGTIELLVEALAQDANTKVIALYIENEKLLQSDIFAKVKKPIIILTPKSTTATRKAALKHTNSKLETVSETASIRDFVGAIQLLSANLSPAKGKRTMLVSDSGGLGILLTASAEENGLRVEPPSFKLSERIKHRLHAIAPKSTISNPLDLINIPGGFSAASIEVLSELQHSSEVDIIIMLLYLIETDAAFSVEYGYGKQLAELARKNKPTIFVCKDFSSPGARALLDSHIPVFRDIETATKSASLICG